MNAEIKKLKSEIKFITSRYDDTKWPPAIGKVVDRLGEQLKQAEIDAAWEQQRRPKWRTKKS